MKYPNPIAIIPNQDLTKITPKGLIKLKKELMLRFELSGKSTIQMGGNALDRQSVLDNLAELQRRPNFHIKIFQYPSLLHFLTKQDLAFFLDTESQVLLQDEFFLRQLQPYFTPLYSEILWKLVSDDFSNNLTDFHKLTPPDFQLPPAYEAICYAKTYAYLKSFVKNLLSEKKKQHRDEIKIFSHAVNPAYIDLFERLPKAYLGPIKADYIQFVEAIIKEFWWGKRISKLMPDRAVLFLHQVLQVSYALTGKHQEELKAIEDFLGTDEWKRGKLKRGCNRILSYIFIIICLSLLIRIPLRCFKVDKQRDVVVATQIIGKWSTIVKRNKQQEILKIVDFQANKTGEMLLIIPDSLAEQVCILTNEFHWRIYLGDLFFGFQGEEFTNSCDSLSKNHINFGPNLASAFAKEEEVILDKHRLKTVYNISSDRDDFFLAVFRRAVGIPAQDFSYVKLQNQAQVDSLIQAKIEQFETQK